MFHSPAAGTRYYRVTRHGLRPSSVLSGMGSYYTLGGRYHRPQQRVVYASDDVLVSVTEMAYYQALEWQERIGSGRAGTPMPRPRPAPPSYPLVSSHVLWCFTLSEPPVVIDVDDPGTYATFQHAAIEILNPGQAYETTQELADRIRAFTAPDHPRPQGIRAPSVRTPVSGGYQPSQYRAVRHEGAEAGRSDRLEGGPDPGVPRRVGERGGPVHPGGGLVLPAVPAPGLPAPIPAFARRPGSRPYHEGRWYPIEIGPI